MNVHVGHVSYQPCVSVRFRIVRFALPAVTTLSTLPFILPHPPTELSLQSHTNPALGRALHPSATPQLPRHTANRNSHPSPSTASSQHKPAVISLLSLATSPTRLASPLLSVVSLTSSLFPHTSTLARIAPAVIQLSLSQPQTSLHLLSLVPLIVTLPAPLNQFAPALLQTTPLLVRLPPRLLRPTLNVLHHSFHLIHHPPALPLSPASLPLPLRLSLPLTLAFSLVHSLQSPLVHTPIHPHILLNNFASISQSALAALPSFHSSSHAASHPEHSASSSRRRRGLRSDRQQSGRVRARGNKAACKVEGSESDVCECRQCLEDRKQAEQEEARLRTIPLWKHPRSCHLLARRRRHLSRRQV